MSTSELVADATLTVDQPSPDDERLWSVTTILKAFGDSGGLIEWTAREVARNAFNGQKVIANMDEHDAVEWLAQSRYKSKGRSATKLGEDVHAAVEILIVTGKRPAMGDHLPNGVMDEEVAPYVDMFESFLERFSPEFKAAEMTVYHPEYGYAGTLDGQAVVEGVPVLFDLKTSKESFDGRGKRKQPWVDVALQLAAYRHAPLAAVWRARKFEQWSRRYYLLNDEERELAVPNPVMEGGLVIHLTPEHCDIYPVNCGEDVFEFFLYAMEGARWSFQESKKVLGAPLALLDRKRP